MGCNIVSKASGSCLRALFTFVMLSITGILSAQVNYVVPTQTLDLSNPYQLTNQAWNLTGNASQAKTVGYGIGSDYVAICPFLTAESAPQNAYVQECAPQAFQDWNGYYGTLYPTVTYSSVWPANGPFLGYWYYSFRSGSTAYNVNRASNTSTFSYRIKSATGVYAMIDGTGLSARMDAYELVGGMVVTPAAQTAAPVAEAKPEVIQIENLNPNKEYLIVIYGNTSARRTLYEVAFRRPQMTAITIDGITANASYIATLKNDHTVTISDGAYYGEPNIVIKTQKDDIVLTDPTVSGTTFTYHFDYNDTPYTLIVENVYTTAVLVDYSAPTLTGSNWNYVFNSTPANATLHYIVNGGTEHTATCGTQVSFPKNATIEYWATAEGYTPSKHATITTSEVSIALGDFDFAKKSYKLTVTGSAPLMVATDGGDYTQYTTSPATIYASSQVKAYSNAGGTASDVQTLDIENSFDPSRPYVAWIYQAGYANGAGEIISHPASQDPIGSQLAASYNVVSIAADKSKSYTQSCPSLGNADLVIITDMMTPGLALSNSLKNLYNQTNVINLCSFSYQTTAWNWGSATDITPHSNVTIAPTNVYMKIFDNVSFNSDGTLDLFNTATYNETYKHLQALTSDNTGLNVLARAGVDDLPFMHASSGKTNKQYLLVSLSGDDYNHYGENAVNLIKTAAQMMLNGTDISTANAKAPAPVITDLGNGSASITTKIFNATIYYVDIAGNQNAGNIMASQNKKTPNAEGLTGKYRNDTRIQAVAEYVVGGTKYYSEVADVTIKGNVLRDVDFAFDATDASILGQAPATQAVAIDDNYVLPFNYTLYKEGYTLTGWRSSINNTVYPCGRILKMANTDVTYTAVFTANAVSLSESKANRTIDWTFANEGYTLTPTGTVGSNMAEPTAAPILNINRATGLYVRRVNITASTTANIDVPLFIDATGSTVTGGEYHYGLLDNTQSSDYAVVNNGTRFTIPAIDQMTINIIGASSAQGTSKNLTFKYEGEDNGMYSFNVQDDENSYRNYYTNLHVYYPKREKVELRTVVVQDATAQNLLFGMGGTTTPASSISGSQGTSITVSNKANYGYAFEYWCYLEKDPTDKKTPPSEFTDITKDATLKATSKVTDVIHNQNGDIIGSTLTFKLRNNDKTFLLARYKRLTTYALTTGSFKDNVSEASNAATREKYGTFTYTSADDEFAPGTTRFTPKTEVTITAERKTGYRFVCWTDENGDELDVEGSRSNPLVITTTNAERKIFARFEDISGGYRIGYYKGNDPDVVGSIPTQGVADATTGEYTFPSFFTIYKEGYTLVGWTPDEGKTVYEIGKTYTLTDDIFVLPVFEENKPGGRIQGHIGNITAIWNLCPSDNVQTFPFGRNEEGVYATKAEVTDAYGEQHVIDIPFFFTTGSKGRLDNTVLQTWCAMGEGTTLTMPSCKGARISLESRHALTSTTIGGIVPTDFTKTASGYLYTIVATTDDETLDIVIGDDYDYYHSVQVVLPEKTSDREIALINTDFSDWSSTYGGRYFSISTDPESTTIRTLEPSEDVTFTAIGTGLSSATISASTPYLAGHAGYIISSGNTEASLSTTRFTSFITRVRYQQGAMTGSGFILEKKGKSDADWKVVTTKTSTSPEWVEAIINESNVALRWRNASFTETTHDAAYMLQLQVYGLDKSAEVQCTVLAESYPSMGGTIEAEPYYKAYPQDGELLQYTQDQIVVLSAKPNFGYQFVNWIDEKGDVLGTTPDLSLTVVRDIELRAVFKPVAVVYYTYGSEILEGNVPEPADARNGAVTIPVNRTLFKNADVTLRGWEDPNDLGHSYTNGATYDFSSTSDHIYLNPIFTDNEGSLRTITSSATAVWRFGRPQGAPDIDLQGKNGLLITQVDINGQDVIDLRMSINTDNGHFSNAGRSDDLAQLSNGVVLTIPATKGMRVELSTSGNVAGTTLAGMTPTGGSGTTAPYYIYKGNRPTATLIISDGAYYRYVQATYYAPVARPEFSDVTSSSVTISDATAGSTIYYTTDGTDPSATNYQGRFTSTAGSTPIGVVNGLGNTKVKAIAIHDDIPDSDIDSVLIVNQEVFYYYNSSVAGYSLDTDPIYTGILDNAMSTAAYRVVAKDLNGAASEAIDHRVVSVISPTVTTNVFTGVGTNRIVNLSSVNLGISTTSFGNCSGKSLLIFDQVLMTSTGNISLFEGDNTAAAVSYGVNYITFSVPAAKISKVNGNAIRIVNNALELLLNKQSSLITTTHPQLRNVMADGTNAATAELLGRLASGSALMLLPNSNDEVLPVLKANGWVGATIDNTRIDIEQATADNGKKATIHLLNADGTTFATYTLEYAFDANPNKEPVLLSSAPTNAATTSRSGDIALQFDVEMQAVSGLTLKVGTTTVGTLSSEQGNTLHFSYWNLEPGKTYTFSIPAGRLRDIYGNAYNKAFNLTFTVGIELMARQKFNFIVDDDINGIKHDGNFATALNRIASHDGSDRFYVFLPEGQYLITEGKEIISSSQVSLIGQNVEKVLVNRASSSVSPATFASALTTTDLYMQDITLEDRVRAGATTSAFADHGQRTILKDVILKGERTTLSTDGRRAYVEGGSISGSVNFISGSGDLFLHGVDLIINQPADACIAAASHSADQKWGYVFDQCVIRPKSAAVAADGVWYLGRPLAGSPAITYINTTMLTTPATVGWTSGAIGLTVRFHEYGSLTGSGTAVDLKRRTISGLSPALDSDAPVLTAAQAETYTVRNVLNGNEGYDPTVYTRQQPVPGTLNVSNAILNWDDQADALCYLIFYKGNGETPSASSQLIKHSACCVTENQLNLMGNQLPEGWYTVRAANQRGGLSPEAEPVYYKTPKAFQMSISSAEWSTIYLDFNASVPAGITAYAAFDLSANTIYLKKVNVLNAETGYVLHGDPALYTFTETTLSSDCPSILSGVLEDTYRGALSAYTLANEPTKYGLGFYNYTGATFKANKAFLSGEVTETNTGAMAPAMRLVILDDDDTTSIEELSILPTGAMIFDLEGRRIDPASLISGQVYLINGEKMRWVE